jgi:hypothetical protein
MSQTIREYLISHLQTVKERKHQAYKRLVPTVTEVTEAAFALGAILGQIEVGYAVCGGTACAFLGGGRSTHAVDRVVKVDAAKVPDIKRQVAEKDPTRFVAIGKSLYFLSTKTPSASPSECYLSKISPGPSRSAKVPSPFHLRR